MYTLIMTFGVPICASFTYLETVHTNSYCTFVKIQCIYMMVLQILCEKINDVQFCK